MSLKTGVGLSAGSGLGLGLGHGYAYSATAAAATSILGPVLLVAGGALLVAGIIRYAKRGKKEAKA